MKIGLLVSFGVGGIDKGSLNLVKGLLNIDSTIEISVFYNKYSHPRQDEIFRNPSRFNEYKNLPIKLIEFNSVEDLLNADIDILNTFRSGELDDGWFIPNFDAFKFNFKVVEINFQGGVKTNPDYRVYLTNTIYNVNNTIPYSIIPNPVITKLTEDNLRKELNIPESAFVCGRIARPDRNIYANINLQAYSRIQTDNTYFLYVAPYQQAIYDAENLKLKNIIFLNPTSDEVFVSKIYNTMDVLCHSNSLGETFGNTIAEAMINGKPVISHVGSNTWPQAQKELLGSYSNELYITEDIVNNYAKTLLKLKENKDFYSSCATYLKNRADSLFNLNLVAKQYIHIYEKLLT